MFEWSPPCPFCGSTTCLAGMCTTKMQGMLPYAEAKGETVKIHVADELPQYSLARRVYIPKRNAIIRTHSPEGFKKVPGTDVKIYLQRNPKIPRVWGWVLAIRDDDLEHEPHLKPGTMIVFKRFADESLGEDAPLESRYIGHTLPVRIIHINSIEAAIEPAIRPLEI